MYSLGPLPTQTHTKRVELQRGYNVVVQDVRGRGESTGVFDCIHDEEDAQVSAFVGPCCGSCCLVIVMMMWPSMCLTRALHIHANTQPRNQT